MEGHTSSHRIRGLEVPHRRYAMYPLRQGGGSSIRVDSDLSNEDKVVQIQSKEESKAQEKGFEVEESVGVRASVSSEDRLLAHEPREWR